MADREALVPPALNPTIPPVVSFLVYRARDSAFGPFALAQVRLTARSGVRPRAFLISARCDNASLSEVLAGSWGFRDRAGGDPRCAASTTGWTARCERRRAG